MLPEAVGDGLLLLLGPACIFGFVAFASLGVMPVASRLQTSVWIEVVYSKIMSTPSRQWNECSVVAIAYPHGENDRLPQRRVITQPKAKTKPKCVDRVIESGRETQNQSLHLSLCLFLCSMSLCFNFLTSFLSLGPSIALSSSKLIF